MYSGGVVNAKFQNNTRSYYNKSAKKLKPLKHGDIVRVQDDSNKCWSRLAQVVSSSESPRSYNVITEDGHGFRRNGRHLGKTQEQFHDKMIMPLTKISILQVRHNQHPK